MPLQVKFEKDYPKLQGLDRAQLLQVLTVNFGELQQAFLDYDSLQEGGTRYWFDFKPDDKVLLLMFGDPATYKTFVTVRRYDKRKHYWYSRGVGEWFEIIRGGGDA